MLEGPGIDSKVDKVLQKMVEMIKTLAHQTNENNLDLCKRWKKVEEKVDSVKAVHKDVKDVRIMVKNIDTSLASYNNEYTDLDKEDKSSEERTQDVHSNDKSS